MAVNPDYEAQIADLTSKLEQATQDINGLHATVHDLTTAQATPSTSTTKTSTSSTTNSGGTESQLGTYVSVFALTSPNVLATNYTTFAVPGSVPISATFVVVEAEGTDIATAALPYLFARANSSQPTPQHIACGRDPTSGAAALKSFVSQARIYFDPVARSFQYQITFAGATVGVSQCFYNLSLKIIGYGS